MKVLSLRGLDVAVEEVGAGQPLVLVHGFPLTRALWAPAAGDLAGDFRTVTYDLRHHGATGGRDDPTTMDDFAADLLALLDELRLASAAVGGLSMGGYVLLHAYRMAPERFTAVLLFDTRATPDAPEARAGRFETAARVRRDGPGSFVDEFLPKLVSPVTLATRPDVVRSAMAMMDLATATGIARTLEALADRPTYVEVLPAIRVPALVVVGEDDAITPPDSARVLARGIRGSRLVVVPEAGHLAPLERPDVVAGAVRDFLREAHSRG